MLGISQVSGWRLHPEGLAGHAAAGCSTREALLQPFLGLKSPCWQGNLSRRGSGDKNKDFESAEEIIFKLVGGIRSSQNKAPGE